MMNERLTGTFRFRVTNSLFSKPLVILQVETEWDNGADDFHGLPSYLAGRGWRDAKPDDLQYITLVDELAQQSKNQVDRTGQTYYRNNDCTAPNAFHKDCICWTKVVKDD